MKKASFHRWIISVAFILMPSMARAQCLECHGDPSLTYVDSAGNTVSLYIDSTVFDNSVHAIIGCQGCHTGITEIPHPEILPKVDCGSCHTDAAAAYQWHGNHKEVTGQLMPECYDCHGRHDILAGTNVNSKVNPLNLPRTCGRCHQNPDIVGKYHIPMVRPVEVFERSVHYRRIAGTDSLAATCVDCHSYQGTGHYIMAPINVESSIYHFSIPKTCGRCHARIEEEYNEGVHGQAAANGEADTPVCTSCHGAHEILPINDPHSPVGPTNVSMTTCAPCHESKLLNIKYGLPQGIIQSWLRSYHGLKSTDGDPTVANCSSCHRSHLILPETDPRSSIAPNNVFATCSRCHPTITPTLARIRIHQTPGVFLNKTGETFRNIYIIAIFVIIGSMLIHWIIDLLKKIRILNRGPQVIRMRKDEVWQHTFLMVTFTVLAVTGFAFHYSGAWWVKLLFGWEGGFQVRRIIHRVAAVIFMATAIWHIVYLLGRRGRQFMKDIFPAPKDFKQFGHTMGYDLGIVRSHPLYGRFSYIEKAEYWALVWGTVVMTLTGLALWFGVVTERLLHVGALGVMLIIHFYEAILASLAILIWHMYSTIFNPPIYPNNPSWYTGKMPEYMYRLEHPEDPVLKDAEALRRIQTGEPTEIPEKPP